MPPAGRLKHDGAICIYDTEMLAAKSLRQYAGLVTTSPLMAMQDDESLVVQYTYTIHDTEAGRLALQLEADAVPPDATGDEETESDGPNRLRVRAARSAVWVEWMGAKPTQVSAPAGTEIDRVQQRVHGLSWAAPATAPGAHFVVTWSR